MKTLLISEDETVNKTLSDFMARRGFDLITYRNLVKAMDNLVEIKPDVIIVSTADYPRHWKVLCQFERSVNGDGSMIILYEPTPLSDSDEEKKNLVGIADFFSSINEEDPAGLSKLSEILDAYKSSFGSTSSVEVNSGLDSNKEQETVQNPQPRKSLLQKIQAMYE